MFGGYGPNAVSFRKDEEKVTSHDHPLTDKFWAGRPNFGHSVVALPQISGIRGKILSYKLINIFLRRRHILSPNGLME